MLSAVFCDHDSLKMITLSGLHCICISLFEMNYSILTILSINLFKKKIKAFPIFWMENYLTKDASK